MSDKNHSESIQPNKNWQPNWKYILAWVILFPLSNITLLGFESIIVSMISMELISAEAALLLGRFMNLPALLFFAYIAYEKVFPELDFDVVWRYLLWLATPLSLMNFGGAVVEIEEVFGDGAALTPTLVSIIMWITFLFLFKRNFSDRLGKNF
jgi:hypothetical protein